MVKEEYIPEMIEKKRHGLYTQKENTLFIPNHVFGREGKELKMDWNRPPTGNDLSQNRETANKMNEGITVHEILFSAHGRPQNAW